jgi:hypothetical protein
MSASKPQYERIDRERIRVIFDGEVVGEITESLHLRLSTGRFFKAWHFGGRDFARRTDAGYAAIRAWHAAQT